MQQNIEKVQHRGSHFAASLMQGLRDTGTRIDKRDHSSKPGLLDCVLLMDCLLSSAGMEAILGQETETKGA